ncbi:MAG TPA: SCO family protein [Acidobacteriaceae bacterium]|nr:SCO family protein [Acidobacteriaceae bacterium]
MRYGVQGLLYGLIFALPMVGCHSSARPAQSAENHVPSGAVKQYAVKGIIVGTDPARGEVTVDTEAIPGFMNAMTMPYKVKDANVLQDLHPGDHMNGELLVGGDSTFLDQIVITAQAQPDYKPQVQFHVPAPGDTVPDFHLTNQSGRQISFRQFRGKALLVTFIYTRCPLSDYCPRMSRNFAAIDKSLQSDPAMYRKTHLLSISFDPAYDSPTVLRSYGEAYTGKYTKEKFEHWDFAAPSKPDLSKLLEFFDVGATPGANHTFTHSLSTAVIAPDGKVAQWYPTNDWKPEDVLNSLKKVAGGAKG